MSTDACSFDIVALSETWLHFGLKDSELFDNSFQVFRRDRYTDSTKLGGGLLIALRSTLNSSRVQFPDDLLILGLEIISLIISFSNKDIYVVSCYVPPNSLSRQFCNGKNIFENLTLHLDYLDDIRGPGDEVILLGDFNLPSVDWVYCREDDVCLPSGDFSAKISDFLDNLSCLGYAQTSCVKNYMGRQLDLVFTTDSGSIITERSPTSLTNTDLYHPPLMVTFGFDTETIRMTEQTTFSFNFRKANFPLIESLLNSTNFQQELSSENIDENAFKFYFILFNIFKKSVPLERKKSLNFTPPWYSKDLIKLKNYKNRLWKKYLKCKSNSNYSNFVNSFNLFQESSSQLYDKYLIEIKNKVFSDSRSFFNFINTKKKSDGYPSTLNFNSESSNDAQVISDFFASFFESAFDSNNFVPSEADFSHISKKVNNFKFPSLTSEVIFSKLEALPEDYSIGPDKVPPIVLKRCAKAFALPLSILYENSISTSTFPCIWKESFIIPIHKKGNKNDICNYRPIAKLSTIPKVFESILYNYFAKICKDIISTNQHGFVQNKSTTTNLLEFSSDIIAAFNSRLQVDCVYTDFSKAFDKLSHSVIVLKMRLLGFPPEFIDCVTSYLDKRTYKVIFRGTESRSINATSGVPQGSHLGPLLFILAIDDVSLILNNAKVLIYADDMKLYSSISSSRDAELLQNDLDSFATWCSKSYLNLNVGKCEFSRFFRIKSPVLFNYKINSSVLKFSNLVTDLGVVFDSKLNFNCHIDKTVTKASQMLGFVKRWSKEFRCPSISRHLYITLVRPILEYACQVWSPFYKVHKDRIEAVQKRFVRFALGHLPWGNPLLLPPYLDRLSLLNLHPLFKRREVHDLVFLHELINLNILCPVLHAKIVFTTSRRSLRSISLFSIPPRNTNYGMHEGIIRMCRLANNTPAFNLTISKHLLKKRLYSV